MDVPKTTFTASINGKNDVCRADDEFVRDRMRWVVVLNNGETVYEDDDRPGCVEPSAWIRLRDYCNTYDYYISELWLQFRSNRVLVEPKNAEGYYLIKSAFGVWGNETTYHAYIVGVCIGGQIVTQRWKVPELTPLDKGLREIDEKSPSLILRPRLTLPGQ